MSKNETRSGFVLNELLDRIPTENEMDKAYSINEEEWPYTEADEALQALADNGDLIEGAVYYEIDCEQCEMSSYLRVDLILDQAGEQIADEIDDADDAFVVSREAKAELDSALKVWTAKHITARYWRCVGNARELKVTADDVAEMRSNTEAKPSGEATSA